MAVCTKEVRRFAASSRENMRERSVLWGSELLDHGQICARGRYCRAWWVRVGGSHPCRRSARQHPHLARFPAVETLGNLRQRSVSKTFSCARGRYYLREGSVFSSDSCARGRYYLPEFLLQPPITSLLTRQNIKAIPLTSCRPTKPTRKNRFAGISFVKFPGRVGNLPCWGR